MNHYRPAAAVPKKPNVGAAALAADRRGGLGSPWRKSPLHSTGVASRLTSLFVGCICQYAPSSRLVRRDRRPSRCDAGFRHGLLEVAGDDACGGVRFVGCGTPRL